VSLGHGIVTDDPTISIGDAVSSRNVHAAVYDSLRLVKDL
jgi:hypothetical protein